MKNPIHQDRNVKRLMLTFGAIFIILTATHGQIISGDAVQHTLNMLPILPQKQITAGQFSSHSEEQHNADYGRFLYRDAHGDAVIFDAQGPGCVTNMWGTMFDSSSVFKFYFDGEEEPRYTTNAIGFYKGENKNFPAPLVSFDRKGYYIEQAYAGNSFAPIYFNHSLKISVTGKPSFYHILYKKIPYSIRWSDSVKNAQRNYLLTVLSHSGKPLPFATSAQTGEQTHTKRLSLEAHKSADVLNYSGKGAVRYLNIETDTSTDFLKNVYIQMIWDNESEAKNNTGTPVFEKSRDNRLLNVMSPVGMFFCSPNFVSQVYSLPIEVRLMSNGRMRMICRLPMPFWRNAHIMLANKSSKDFNDITATVITSTTEYPEAQTGYFTTFYHKGMTEYGRDWAFCNYKGAGWFLGVVQSCRLEHYCEGNEHFYIDGNETPQINGTGTEDYYLGCFWPNIRYNTPFAGCVNDVRLLSGGDPNAYLKVFNKDYLVPATYYRFHLEMPIPFYSSMDAFIQHGAESNIQSEYASLAYLYIKNTPVLHEVDFMDVGSPASLSAHAYQSSGTLKKEKLTANYEGNYLYTNITALGFYHRAGETTFTVSIPKENAGIRLRRRTDQGSGPQSAAVYVNGKFAGNWVDPQTNKTLRWFDSEFDIPESLTRNQNSLQIKLVIKNKNAFNDFNYRVLAYNYAD